MSFNRRDFSTDFALVAALLAPSAALAQYGGRPTIPPAVVERLENEIAEQRQRIDTLMRRSMTVFDEDTILKRLKAVEERQKLFEDAFIKKMEEGKVRKP